MLNKKGRLFLFGPFFLNTAERTFRKDSELIQLTPKVFDLLTVMVENPGRLLEKDSLLKELWPETFVEEANLSVNVSTLRRALGESPLEVRYIETVPKRGYRFIAEVREITLEAPIADLVSSAVEAPNARSDVSRRSSRRWLVAAWIAAGVLIVLGCVYIAAIKNASPAADIRSIAVLPFKPLQD